MPHPLRLNHFAAQRRALRLQALLATGLALSPGWAAAQEAAVIESTVITASQTAKSTLKAPASVSVVTREELESEVVLDLADALRRVPGVYINPSSTSGRNEIKIRGMKADYTLLLVNGRRINSRDALTSAYANDFDLSSIPVAAIERIEVIRGAMSSLYGADALGGVVNVILRQPDEAFEGSLGYQYEALTEGHGGNARKASAYLGGPLIADRLLANISLESRQRDDWQSGDAQNPRADSLEARDDWGVLSNFKWLLDDNQDLDLDLAISEDDRNADWNNYGTTPNNIQDMQRVTFGVGHNGRWDRLDTRVRYYLEQVELHDDSELNRQVADIEQTNQTLDGQVTRYFAAHTLILGGEYRQTELDNSMNLPGGAVKVKQSALYLQDEFSLGDFDFTLGARFDDHEVYGNELSPRAYVVYNLSDDWVIKGGVASSFKAPTIAQSNPDYRISSCRGMCSLVGNDSLDPETATNYELGTHYQGARWGAGATLFHNDIEDMIVADSWNRRPGALLSYHNVSQARVRGIELSGWVDLNDSLSLSADLTLVDAKDRDTDEDLTLTPQSTFNTRLNWQARADLSAYLAYQHIGRQYVRVDERSSGYGTLDVGLLYSGIRDVELSFGLNNLGNTKRDDTAEQYDYIMQPRSVFAGVTYNF